MAIAAAAARIELDFTAESTLARDLERLKFPLFLFKTIVEVLSDPSVDWTNDVMIKKIALQCDMHKFFTTIKRAVKKYNLDVCFAPTWDVQAATTACTTNAQRTVVKNELFTILTMVCGGDASLVIEGVDDDDGAAAITALWENNNVVTALSRDYAKKFLEITAIFPTDSTPQVTLSKIQFIINFTNNFDDDDQINTARYKSILIEIAGRSGKIYESLPLFKVNNADVYEATTVQKLRAQIMGLFRLETEKGKFVGQMTRFNKGGASSGNTETGEKPEEKTKLFYLPKSLTKKNIVSMKTALVQEGYVVMSQEQLAHERKGNNTGNGGNTSSNKINKKGCSICFERYGPNWKVSHSTKEHNSDHYKAKEKKNGEGFERMNFRSNR